MPDYTVLSASTTSDLVANVLTAFNANWTGLAVIAILVIAVPFAFYIIRKVVGLFRSSTR